MTSQAIIVGTGSFAEVVTYYLSQDSETEVVGYTESAERRTENEFLGQPLVDFEDVEQHFDPATHKMFVAIGYAKLNRVREEVCGEARSKGYTLLSYVCSKASIWGEVAIGDNVFVFEDNTLQPFVSIGDGTILWSGNHVGHHATIGAYCFITSHSVISGHCRIGDRCFLGVNSTIADDITIGDDNLIGPGALIQKSTGEGEVYLAERSRKFAKGSDYFFR